MSTAMVLKQSERFFSLTEGATPEQMQNLLGNRDLLELMLDADLSQVDRREFARVLAGHGASAHAPYWYTRTPEQQLEFVRRLNVTRRWGFLDSEFPSPPTQLTLTSTEVLVLAINLNAKAIMGGLQRTVVEHWRAIPELINGYAKAHWKGLKFDTARLRMTQGTWKPGLRWVIIDLAAYAGKSPHDALEMANADNQVLAGTELLSLLLLQPRWIINRDLALSEPLPLNIGGVWLRQPGFDPGALLLTQGYGARQFRLTADRAHGVEVCWSSPTIREC